MVNDVRAVHVVGGGMSGRVCEISEEAWPCRRSRSGVRAHIVPMRRKPREAGLAKPGRGKVGQEGGCVKTERGQ
jgi:hypothetical protein